MKLQAQHWVSLTKVYNPATYKGSHRSSHSIMYIYHNHTTLDCIFSTYKWCINKVSNLNLTHWIFSMLISVEAGSVWAPGHCPSCCITTYPFAMPDLFSSSFLHSSIYANMCKYISSSLSHFSLQTRSDKLPLLGFLVFICKVRFVYSEQLASSDSSR